MPRTFIVGDIHGCYDELIALTEQVNLKADDLLISVGDIVDRGNKSKEVYEYFLNRPNSVVLMGNHERKHMNNVLTYAQEIVKYQFDKDYDAFVEWLDTIGYYYETEDAIIVHAAFENGKPLAMQRPEVLCGSTTGERYLETLYAAETYWNDYYDGTKPIIYGHRVVGDEPLIKNNTYGIDTGACHGGYLTAIELPGFIIHQVKAKADYWASERKVWQTAVLQARDWLNTDFTTIHKQVGKLSFHAEGDPAEFIERLRRWADTLENLLPELKVKIEAFADALIAQHPDDFNRVASGYSFKTYLFKAKGNNLKMDDLLKSLNTPQKVIDIAEQLGLKSVVTF